VKGREKKKGIKAAIGSNAGSKRKLSRMGKKQKKEHSGLEASFIGRSACIKMLQVSIKDFRRLCILKGIYPREPLGNRVPGKKKGQTYYHVKDIRAIAHEPILEKFREFRSFMKKVRIRLVPYIYGCLRCDSSTKNTTSFGNKSRCYRYDVRLVETKPLKHRESTPFYQLIL
jgi:Pescadillo N-terminus